MERNDIKYYIYGEINCLVWHDDDDDNNNVEDDG